MNITPMFVTGVANTQCPDLLLRARELFERIETRELPGSNGLKTSLRSYNNGKGQDIQAFCIPDELEDRFCELAKTFMGKEGYAVDRYDFKLNNLWLNDMTSGSHHYNHHHIGNTISGCFYVDLPKNSDKVLFIGPMERYDLDNLIISQKTPYNSDKWTMQPKEGDVFLWHSHLKHGVESMQFEGLRRTIAFDVVTTLKIVR